MHAASEGVVEGRQPGRYRGVGALPALAFHVRGRLGADRVARFGPPGGSRHGVPTPQAARTETPSANAPVAGRRLPARRPRLDLGLRGSSRRSARPWGTRIGRTTCTRAQAPPHEPPLPPIGAYGSTLGHQHSIRQPPRLTGEGREFNGKRTGPRGGRFSHPSTQAPRSPGWNQSRYGLTATRRATCAAATRATADLPPFRVFSHLTTLIPPPPLHLSLPFWP